MGDIGGTNFRLRLTALEKETKLPSIVYECSHLTKKDISFKDTITNFLSSSAVSHKVAQYPLIPDYIILALNDVVIEGECMDYAPESEQRLRE